MEKKPRQYKSAARGSRAAKSGRKMPWLPNPALNSVSKYQAAEYINKVLTSNGECRYVTLKPLPDDFVPTKENCHLTPQNSVPSTAVKTRNPLTQSASSLGNRLGFFDFDTLSFFAEKTELASTSPINMAWEEARLRCWYGGENVKYESRSLPMEVYCAFGSEHEELHNILYAQQHPNDIIYESGLTYFEIPEGVLRDYLSDNPSAKIQHVCFDAAESPDALITVRDSNGKVLARKTGEFKCPTMLIPKKLAENDDAFQNFDCYEYFPVDRKVYDLIPAYYFLQLQWQMFGERCVQREQYGQNSNIKVESCHFQCLTMKRGARVWNVPFREDIVAMCVSLLNHVVSTFINPPNGAHQPVPTNYFSQMAPERVRRLHRQMLTEIRKVLHDINPIDIPSDLTNDLLFTLQCHFRPNEHLKELNWTAGLPPPLFPKCMPSWTRVFVYRVAFLGERQTVMANIVKNSDEIQKRTENIEALLSGAPVLGAAGSFFYKYYMEEASDYIVKLKKSQTFVKAQTHSQSNDYDVQSLSEHATKTALTNTEIMLDRMGSIAYSALFVDNQFNANLSLGGIRDADHGQTFLRQLMIRAGGILEKFFSKIPDNPDILPLIDSDPVELSRKRVAATIKTGIRICTLYGLKKTETGEYEHFVETEQVFNTIRLIEILVYHNAGTKHQEIARALEVLRNLYYFYQNSAKLVAALAFMEILGYRSPPPRSVVVKETPDAANISNSNNNNNNNNNE